MRQVTHRRLLQQAHQKSGSFPPPALPSFIGTTTLSDSRSSRCPTAPLRPLPSLSTGLPRLRDPLSRRAVPITPVDRSRCVCRLLPQIVLPSPNSGRVGVHNFPFEACSGFTHVTARRFARPRRTPASAGAGFCRRASIQPIAQLSRLPATGPTDHCPGGTCTHKVIAPFGAHRRAAEDKGLRFARSTNFYLRGTPCELRVNTSSCNGGHPPAMVPPVQHPSMGGLHERLQSASSARSCLGPATHRRGAGQRPGLTLPHQHTVGRL